eukprot:scaffold19151_cov40-Tisochrysis_lutea.AAC.1
MVRVGERGIHPHFTRLVVAPDSCVTGYPSHSRGTSLLPPLSPHLPCHNPNLARIQNTCLYVVEERMITIYAVMSLTACWLAEAKQMRPDLILKNQAVHPVLVPEGANTMRDPRTFLSQVDSNRVPSA